MARKVTAFLMTLCLLFAAEAKAINGNQWNQLSQTQQQAYVMGVVDAWYNLGEAASLVKQQQPSVVTNFTKVVKCIKEGMTYGQINAIVQKYMENNPSQWHYVMASLIWVAFDEVCETKSK